MNMCVCVCLCKQLSKPPLLQIQPIEACQVLSEKGRVPLLCSEKEERKMDGKGGQVEKE